ncbi:hypothetical protein MM236_12915 [Belliella sp. DSM 107340]|uniref:Lipocalin-like domain-containing protein n=1 Tax=Belliella calami TaxID=2923436 RepID=A0ABS9UR11_9BACT|nr:hypothetical protein [Belliella calami]MCH7398899.1 hypothetical protein [Belliella calami]
MKKILLAFSVLLFFASCMDNDGDVQENGQFPLGNWTISESHENGFSLTRTESLPENNSGFSFRNNGKMTSRAMAGWCGTPPVAYADYAGNWSNTNGALRLNMGFWGGRNIQEWKVISSNDTGDIVRVELVSSEIIQD